MSILYTKGISSSFVAQLHNINCQELNLKNHKEYNIILVSYVQFKSTHFMKFKQS